MGSHENTIVLDEEVEEMEESEQRDKELASKINSIQEFVTKFNLQDQLKIPELVFVGGQSAGKSTLIEGFAGCRFNFVAAKIATKVPLVLQMEQHDNYVVPTWILTYKGQSYTYTDTKDLSSKLESINSAFGDSEVGTEEIILKEKFNNCINLTIVDLPGLRFNSQNRKIAQAIDSLARKFLKSDNRTIVCVERVSDDMTQFSAFAWIRNNIDPQLKRTILVVNKFDMFVPLDDTVKVPNASTVLSVLEGDRSAVPEHLYEQNKLYFTSMPIKPKEGNQTDKGFTEQIKRNDEMMVAKLNQINAPQDVISRRIGFSKFSVFLSQFQKRAFAESSQDLCHKMNQLINRNKEILKSTRVQIQQLDEKRLDLMLENCAQRFVVALHQVLIIGDANRERISKFGQTLTEEKKAYKEGSWMPSKRGVKDFDYFSELQDLVPNENFPSYGGSQYLRLCEEIKLAILSLEIPALTQGEIAQAMFQGASDTLVYTKAVVSRLVKNVSGGIFVPTIQTACRRLKYVLLRSVDAALDIVCNETRLTEDTERIIPEFLKSFPVAKDAIKDRYAVFVNNLVDELEEDLVGYTKCVTECIGWNGGRLSKPTMILDDHELLVPSREITKQRVKKRMNPGANTEEDKILAGYETFPAHHQVTNDLQKKCQMLTALNWSVLREYVVTYVALKMNYSVKRPINTELASTMKGLSVELDLFRLVKDQREKLQRKAIELNSMVSELEQRLESLHAL